MSEHWDSVRAEREGRRLYDEGAAANSRSEHHDLEQAVYFSVGTVALTLAAILAGLERLEERLEDLS